MPKVQNTFLKGKMDSDTNYSLIGNDTYVRAENVRISGEGNDGAGSQRGAGKLPRRRSGLRPDAARRSRVRTKDGARLSGARHLPLPAEKARGRISPQFAVITCSKRR